MDSVPKSRRKQVTLTIREDVMREAKALSLNASKAAEAGILDALRKARAETWLTQNADAIEAYNLKIDRRGIAIPPVWSNRP